MYPASTTKIMTAILSIENCNLDDITTVSENAVKSVPSGYTNAKLVIGEKISIRDLLYGLMLNSANEAANVLAEHISGSVEEFAKLMTKKAKKLGCTSTNFVNANGMHNDNHYTTAEDLTKIAIYCMKNETFREIVSTVEYELPATNLYTKNDRIMKNTNLLINPESQYYMENAIGIKTGYTTQAGNCLVSCIKTDDVELYCVTLKAGSTTNASSYRFADSKALLTFGMEEFSNRNVIEKETVIEVVPIENATNETKMLNIITKDTVSDFIYNDIDFEELNPKIEIADNLSAPISKGEKLGTITYTINDKTYTSDLIAENNVEKDYSFVIYSLIAGTVLLVVAIIIIFVVSRKK